MYSWNQFDWLFSCVCPCPPWNNFQLKQLCVIAVRQHRDECRLWNSLRVGLVNHLGHDICQQLEIWVATFYATKESIPRDSDVEAFADQMIERRKKGLTWLLNFICLWYCFKTSKIFNKLKHLDVSKIKQEYVYPDEDLTCAIEVITSCIPRVLLPLSFYSATLAASTTAFRPFIPTQSRAGGVVVREQRGGGG